MSLMQVKVYSRQYTQILCWQGQGRSLPGDWGSLCWLEPVGASSPSLRSRGCRSNEVGATTALSVRGQGGTGPPLWGPQQELMGGGGRGENIKTNPGGPKDHGRRNSCHEHHVPPTERLEAVATLMQTPFCLGKVGAAARRARTSIGRVRLTPE